MKHFVVAALAASSMIALAAPADAQWRRDRWGSRDRVIVQEAPGISTGTLATILAIQALQAQSQQKETVVVRERESREYVPLK